MKNLLLINERSFLLDAYLQLNLLNHKLINKKNIDPNQGEICTFYAQYSMCAFLKISASNINQMSQFNCELTSIVDSSNKLMILLLNVTT